MPAPTSILFVCLGNICRSPLAEGVFADAARAAGRETAFRLDSAGTGAWHAGSPPDPRSIEIAARNGIDISGQRARKVSPGDFRRFDLILGMDSSNVAQLHEVAPGARGEDPSVPGLCGRAQRKTCRIPIMAGRMASRRSTG